MARLISEDDVMRMLTSVALNNGTITDAKSELRNVKTAYDIERVVAELKETNKNEVNAGMCPSGFIHCLTAIDIVRKDGVE